MWRDVYYRLFLYVYRREDSRSLRRERSFSLMDLKFLLLQGCTKFSLGENGVLL
jgi:hypothetical protein